MHGPGDVLDLLLAEILEREVELVANLVVYHPADADPTRLGKRFEACGDIDAVAVDVAAIPDDVAEVDPHAEFDPPRLRNLSVALGHPLLHLDRAAHRRPRWQIRSTA